VEHTQGEREGEEVNILKKLSLDDFMRLRKLVHRSARPLDFIRWNYLFENGSCEDFLSVLSSYQNEDGGFGYNIECNNWNPNSSPYTVCIALDYLDTAGDYDSSIKNKMVKGIIQYLASGAFMTENGWVGMQGIPSNNDFSHLPWFHYDPKKAAQADIGVTKRLSDFILKYADEGSDIYQKALFLQARYKPCGQILLNGFPDVDPASLVDPASSDNLDTVVDTLRNTHEIHIMPEKELKAWERKNPHPDGRRRRWGGAEQAIGNYYWGAHGITSNLDLLRKFDRLDFQMPIENLV